MVDQQRQHSGGSDERRGQNQQSAQSAKAGHGHGRGGQGRQSNGLRVRVVRRRETDLRKLGRAILEIARVQLEIDAQSDAAAAASRPEAGSDSGGAA